MGSASVSLDTFMTANRILAKAVTHLVQPALKLTNVQLARQVK